MSIFRPTTAVSVMILLTHYSLAQIETDRPDFTENPNLVPNGALQIESGFVLENDQTNLCGINRTHRNTTLNTTLFRYGLLDNLEIRLNWNYVETKDQTEYYPTLDPCENNPGQIKQTISETHSAFEPLFIGFKTNLWKGDRISIGFLGHLYLPFTGRKPFMIAHYTPEFLIPMTIDLSDRFGLAMQWSMHWDGNSPRSETGYTLSLSYAISDKLSAFVEPYGSIIENEAEYHKINGGFAYLVNDNFQIDLSGGSKLSSNAPDGFIGCGFSVLLDR